MTTFVKVSLPSPDKGGIIQPNALHVLKMRAGYVKRQTEAGEQGDRRNCVLKLQELLETDDSTFKSYGIARGGEAWSVFNGILSRAKRRLLSEDLQCAKDCSCFFERLFDHPHAFSRQGLQTF